MDRKIKILHDVLGVSYNDAKAMLAQLQESQTVDEIPLQELRKLTRTDSSTNLLNKEHNLSRNANDD